MDDLISVICTVKNGENTIIETLESVRNQSYTLWELIIIDDGSNDATVDILMEYAELDSRIKPHFTNGIGRGKALNMAINLSSSDYIANIDADDLMHPKRLQYQLEIMQKHSHFLIGTGTVFLYENERINWEVINRNYNVIEVSMNNLLIRNQINHSSVMIRKKDLIKLGNYDEHRKSQLDYELWLRALINKLPMFIINEKLTAKRIHRNQSYENRKRIKYTFNSMVLQLRYITFSGKLHLCPIPIINFFLGQLPFKFRRLLVNSISKG